MKRHPQRNEVVVRFADDTYEAIVPPTGLRLENGGWLVIIDHVEDERLGRVERSRAFPPSSITSVITLRPEGD